MRLHAHRLLLRSEIRLERLLQLRREPIEIDALRLDFRA
jgi:hypothetical protein